MASVPFISMRLHYQVAFFLIAPLLAVLPCAAQPGRVAVAYTDGGDLHLATQSGALLRAVQHKMHFVSFAVSSDAQRVIFSSNETDYGGQLYLLSIQRGAMERLTVGNYFVKGEVYDDPEFSPDGQQVAFAVHGSSHGDLIEASGPLATINLRNHKVAVVQSTEASGFVNDPHWSPDGRRILVNFETGAAIVDLTGAKPRSLFRGSNWTHAFGWIGNNCVVYIEGTDQKDAMSRPFKVFVLSSSTTVEAAKIFSAAPQSLAGLITSSFPYWIRQTASALVVEGGSRPWSISSPKSRQVFARIVPAPTPSEKIPEMCH